MSEVSYDPNKAAVVITAQEDPEPRALDYDFSPRARCLTEGGLSVELTPAMATIFAIDHHLSSNYPDGCFYLLTRVHGSPTEGVFSYEEGGRFAMDLSDLEQKTLERICQTVRPGGVFVSESCLNGAGKGNLLKYLAKHCCVGVVVIGSKVAGFSIQTNENPKDVRFISANEEDATRIYYQTEQGPRNISIAQLNVLLALLGRGPRELDLCYRFLGERGDAAREECKQEALRSGDVEAFKEALRSTRISQAEVSKPWKEMLTAFATGANVADAASIEIDPRVNELAPDAAGTLHLNRYSDNARNAYQLLLSMAALDRYQEILSLIDTEEDSTAYGIPAQCIYALTGNYLHPVPGQPVTQTLASYIARVKQSYQFAVERNLLPQWIDALLAVTNPCIDAHVDALIQFQAQTMIVEETKTDKIRAAIREDQLDTLESLLINSDNISEENRGLAVLDATAVSNVEAVALLLVSGNISDKDRLAAIQLATDLDSSEIVQLLLCSGNIPESERQALLQKVIKTGQKAVRRELESPIHSRLKQLTPEERGELLQTIRSEAIQFMIAALVSGEISQESPNDYKLKAIEAAFETGYVELVPLLLASGKTTDEHRKAALYFAIEKGHEQLAALILSSNAMKSSELDGPLVAAIAYGRQHVVETILDMQPLASESLFNVITEILYHNQLGMLQIVLDSEKFSDEQWSSVAELAAARGYFDVVKLLLDAGKILDESKNLIFTYTAEYNQLPLLKQLLIANMPIEVACTALNLAAENGHTQIVDALIDAFSGFSEQAMLDASVRAVANGQQQMVDHLFARNALSPRCRYSLLCAFVSKNDLQGVKMLLSRDLQVDLSPIFLEAVLKPKI